MKRTGVPVKSHFARNWFLKEALEVEVQGLLLIGEEQKDRRCRLRLGHVIDAHRPGFRVGGALQIHIFLQPTIQLAGGDFTVARLRHVVDQRIELLGALAGFCRKEK